MTYESYVTRFQFPTRKQKAFLFLRILCVIMLVCAFSTTFHGSGKKQLCHCSPKLNDIHRRNYYENLFAFICSWFIFGRSIDLVIYKLAVSIPEKLKKKKEHFLKLWLHREHEKKNNNGFHIRNRSNYFRVTLYPISLSFDSLQLWFVVHDGRAKCELHWCCWPKPVPVWMQIQFWCHFGFLNHSITSTWTENIKTENKYILICKPFSINR